MTVSLFNLIVAALVIVATTIVGVTMVHWMLERRTYL